MLNLRQQNHPVKTSDAISCLSWVKISTTRKNIAVNSTKLQNLVKPSLTSEKVTPKTLQTGNILNKGLYFTSLVL